MGRSWPLPASRARAQFAIAKRPLTGLGPEGLRPKGRSHPLARCCASRMTERVMGDPARGSGQYKQTCDPLPRRIQASGLGSFLPHRASVRGMARRKAQVHYGSSLCGARRRLSARHERRLCDHRAAFSQEVSRDTAKLSQVVSRLLAGGLSLRPEAPGAARVPGLRRPAAPHLVPPHDASRNAP